MGRSWPNQKHPPKGASSHSPESRHWPDSKPVQQRWAARKPAAPYVRCVFRSSHVDFAHFSHKIFPTAHLAFVSLYHGALSAFVSLYHGALSARRSRSSSSSSCLRHPPHRRTPPTSARPPLAITPPRKRRTTASALRAPSCTEDNHYDRYISRQANICGDRQDPLRSRLSR